MVIIGLNVSVVSRLSYYIMSPFLPARRWSLDKKVLLLDLTPQHHHHLHNHHHHHRQAAFSYYAPKRWNALPQHIREAETIGAFKRHLKTHLFNIAYS